ncbi:gamma carbonic anhydrase family protein [Deinococcus sp.]|uniref:gamma carbonic anhydrase family protein n=1 Tax=Deinococcus sp. TaxID=47478 RepID=UPI0025ECF782|nr:gamma carbonic anhydrase family protein [Deinococcus sp.]
MALRGLGGDWPQVHPSAFIAPGAELIGQVSVGEHASVWFGAVLRGDIEAITVGAGSNVQDGAVLHTDAGFPCVLEENVTVGHRAVVHGATCEAGSLVGIGAIMLSGSRLGRGAVLGAGALLPEGRQVPPRMLALGVPARVVRPVSPSQTGLGHLAERYVTRARQYLSELEPDRPESARPEPIRPEQARPNIQAPLNVDTACQGEPS